MSRIISCLKRRQRAYADSDVPWDLADAETSVHSRLFRYLRGGGSKAFGLTTQSMREMRRQTRFLVFFTGLLVLWIVFYFV